jgi:hypothetical protein
MTKPELIVLQTKSGEISAWINIDQNGDVFADVGILSATIFRGSIVEVAIRILELCNVPWEKRK